MMNFSAELALAEQVARDAGASLLADFRALGDLRIDVKGPGDFVSEADRKSENMIVAALLAARPDWGILGEEGTDRIGEDPRYRWIIDPLDGTNNFLHGVPHWNVTVGLEKDGEIVAGVVFAPVLGEMFTAEKGRGACLNGHPIRVSRRMDLMDAMVVVDPGYTRKDDALFTFFEKTVSLTERRTGGVRIGGSCALDMAYVAAGRTDVLVHAGGAKPWDIAAGLLLVREAGGMVTDLELKTATADHHQILAANNELHGKYAALIGL